MNDNIIGVELQLPDFTNVVDMNFDFGLLELEYEGKKIVTDSIDSNYDSFNMTVNISFKVDLDVIENSDSKQDLTMYDIIDTDKLNIDFYIGCEYTIEPEVKTLFLKDRGCVMAIEF